MKTIIYSLIAILFFGTISTGFTDKPDSKIRILIQSTDKNTTTATLEQSARIITDRLNDFNQGKFELKMFPEKNQIQVILSGETDLIIIKNILIKKGTIEFFETWNNKDLDELLKGDKRLFSLLTVTDPEHSDPRDVKVGCTRSSEVEKVNEYLKTTELNNKCRFSWTQNFDSSGVCLYALKNYGEKGALITGSDIDSAKYFQDRIQISLKKSVVQTWADATKRNLNNVIAIVLDNHVISSPRVMSPMESGEIEISGKFTKTEAGYIATMLNNGELPVTFSIIK